MQGHVVVFYDYCNGPLVFKYMGISCSSLGLDRTLAGPFFG